MVEASANRHSHTMVICAYSPRRPGPSPRERPSQHRRAASQARPHATVNRERAAGQLRGRVQVMRAKSRTIRRHARARLVMSAPSG
jgi:hypothetical protein